MDLSIIKPTEIEVMSYTLKYGTLVS